jgi:excisionase family DNA binding protein
MRTVIDQHEDLLTVAEVARLLRVAPSTVRKWIAREQIPYLALPGGDYRVPRLALFRALPSNVDAAAVLARVQQRLASVVEDELRTEVAAVRAARRDA